MGAAYRRDQFAFGFPMPCELGEPRVRPPSFGAAEILAWGDLFASASSRFVSAKGGQGPKADELSSEAISQVEKNWLRGPHQYSPKGEVWADGELIVVNPAFNFGVLQADILRAVDDLKMCSTNEATLCENSDQFTPMGPLSSDVYAF